jgi:hypothetical protein
MNVKEFEWIYSTAVCREQVCRQNISQKRYKSLSFFSKHPRSSTTPMAFKKSLAALFFALPLVLGTNLYFRNNVNVLTTVAASPTKRSTNPACAFLEPIKKDLIDNLFDGKCGDAVSVFSSSVLSTFI